MSNDPRSQACPIPYRWNPTRGHTAFILSCPNRAASQNASLVGASMRVFRRRPVVVLIVLFFTHLFTWPSHAGPQDMLALMQRITALAKDGRYGEATALARKLESDAEQATGPQSPLT